ncbi:hypothetical protein [Comamonas composti]|uniref:hypothetical protein n=1 Tax=Comamonas composti TaxID=408558 RepID=UPI00041D3C3F|nr:hypothetical protein [Comamonas composti]
MLGLFRRSAHYACADAQPAAPATYAQWSECLDLLAQGLHDEECLARMGSGQLVWTAGVAPLFAQRLSEELQRRLGLCADRLTRDLRTGSSEQNVVKAILQARAQLFFLQRLCQLPMLPAPVKEQLLDEVQRFAERSQNSLLDSARADRSGRLASVLRNNPLTRYQDQPLAAAPAAASAPAAAAPIGAPGRRRNILF